MQGLYWFHTEPLAELRYKDLIEVAGCVFGIDNPVKSQFGYQPILKGLIDPLSSSPGLGRVCKDESYAEFSHSPFKLGGCCITLGHIEASVTGGGKLGCTIKVKTNRKTIPRKDCTDHQKTSLQIFLFLKQAIERFAGGIIGSKEQRAPFFPEPPVGRTIKEEHLPLPF